VLGRVPKVTLSVHAGHRRSEWLGHIVRSEEMVDPMNRMVYVVAQVADPYGLANGNAAPLRSGTFLNATITGRTENGIFTLQRSALRGKNEVWIASEREVKIHIFDSFKWYCLMDEYKLKSRKVNVVYTDSSQAILSGGIRSGEKVIVSLLTGVIDGMSVAVRELESTNE